MNIHHLKTIQPFYNAVISGNKTFDVRLDDRGFEVGDLLYLEEYIDGKYTGRSISFRISYLLKNYPGIDPEYVVLALGAV